MNPPSRANLFILNNITHIASLLLLCVSRYAAVAKNSHCTQSYSKCVESYHAHCLPREGLEYRHTLRPSRNSHCTQSYSKYVVSYHAHCEPFAPLRISIRGGRKKLTLHAIYSKYICIISRTLPAPAKGLSIGIHCAPRGTATARNLTQNTLCHITHIVSLLLLCVSRYAAVAKNSHCTQSIQNIFVSYHAH